MRKFWLCLWVMVVWFSVFSFSCPEDSSAMVIYEVTFPGNVEKCEFEPPEAWGGDSNLIICYRKESAWATKLDDWCNPSGYYYTDWSYVYFSQDGVNWQNIGKL